MQEYLGGTTLSKDNPHFKKGSAFQKDIFQTENDRELNTDEAKDVADTESVETKKKILSGIQSKNDEKFLKAMENEDTGRQYVADVETDKLQKAYEQKQEAMDFMEQGRRIGNASYRTNLAEWGMFNLMNKWIPKEFFFTCIPTSKGTVNIKGRTFNSEEGIVFILEDEKGNIYAKAMRASYDVEVDAKAASLLALEVENTVDYLRGRLDTGENPTGLTVKDILTP